MNSFDGGIISFFNAYARRSWILDELIVFLSEDPLLRGGVLAGLFWWAWFRYRQNGRQEREFLLYGLLASVPALLLARALALTLPFRQRPLHDPLLHFRLPYGLDISLLEGWSSFPSHHATLFFTLATSLFFASRGAGTFLLIYSFVAVCLPRIYLGIHYPTDILAGALLGIGLAYLSKNAAIRKTTTRPLMRWLDQRPELFYVFFFVLTFEVVELFWSLRHMLRFVRELAGELMHYLQTPH